MALTLHPGNGRQHDRRSAVGRLRFEFRGVCIHESSPTWTVKTQEKCRSTAATKVDTGMDVSGFCGYPCMATNDGWGIWRQQEGKGAA